jgi:hypothetical protein
MMRRACRAIAWLSLVWLVGAGLALPAWAHKPSDSYLTLRVEPGKIDGQWDIALRDLDHAIGLDADDNGEITWGELRASHPEIAAYALARLQVAGDDQACALSAGEQLVDQHSDGAYAVLRFTVACAQPPTVLRIGYRLFADTDPQHRGLLRLETVGASRSAIFSPEAPQQTFALATPGRWAQFVAYARDGVWHIWIGYDHILFLLSLLLPAVGAWRARHWQAVASFREASVDVVKIVSAFTLAHSITLSLATLGWVALPSRWVESAIAASVVLAALNNLFPLVHGRRWAVAFAFGLVHGFGFASVLADLGLTQSTLALALVGFNLGVEAGQLAIVAAFLPLAFALRHGRIYRWGLFGAGSALIALLASVWLAERALDLRLF